jgi:hypothetical protein
MKKAIPCARTRWPGELKQVLATYLGMALCAFVYIFSQW